MKKSKLKSFILAATVSLSLGSSFNNANAFYSVGEAFFNLKSAGQMAVGGLYFFIAGPHLTIEAIKNGYWDSLSTVAGCYFWCPLAGVMLLDSNSASTVQFNSLKNSVYIREQLRAGKITAIQLNSYEDDKEILNALMENLTSELNTIQNDTQKSEYAIQFWKDNANFISNHTFEFLNNIEERH